MKPFQKFLILFALPLLLIGTVSFLISGNFADIKNERVTFFTIVFFGILAACQVFFYDRQIRRNQPMFQSIARTSLFLFVCVFIFSVVANEFLGIYFNLYVSFFQGFLMVCLFYLSIFITMAYRWSKQKTILHFDESRRFYLRMILGITMAVSGLFIAMTSDRYFLNHITLAELSPEIGFVFRTVAVNTLASFFSIFLLTRIRLLKQNALLLVIVSSLLLTVLNYGAWSNFTEDFFKFFVKYYMILLFITLCNVTVIMYRNRLRSKTLRINKLAFSFSQKEAEYLQLKNQINPHFLFNNLNTLISFIETEPTKAIDFGNHLSNVYRHYLKNQPEDFVLLQDELRFISEYLAIYKAKFESGFSFEIGIPEKADVYILASALQEIIDNVFKHNAIDTQNPLVIAIAVESNWLVIQNTVHLKTAVHSAQTGIENIRKRYQILSKKEIIIEKNSSHFTVRLPIFETETE